MKKGFRQGFRLEHWHLISVLLVIYDLVAVNLAYFLALWLRFDCSYTQIPWTYMETYLHFLPIYTVACIVVFSCMRMYNSIWRFASISELFFAMGATVITGVIQILGTILMFVRMPVSYYIFGMGIQFLLVLGVRFSYRLILLERNKLKKTVKRGKRVMLIGAGNAGQMLLRDIAIFKEERMQVCCIIDDNPNKWGRYIGGVPVVGGRYDILESVEKYRIEKIFVAIPSASEVDKRDILNICKEAGCELKNLPGMYQLVSGQVRVSDMQDVAVEDLLGRDPIRVDMAQIGEHICGKTILVTGGGGSIGSELCRQIAAHNPASLTIFDIYENNAYDIEMELRRTYPYLTLRVLIGSVRDERRVADVFAQVAPHVVFHAAAHKHVPLMENSPAEAVKNNVFGTYNVAKAASDFGVERFVMISTDKAVNPTNVMGATKRICEMIVQNFAAQSKTTDYVAVRFGNVLGSNGSVIPLFKRQISEGGPVTVTHKDIIRYFMTIPEAVSLVLQAGAYAADGEVFVLDMGEPVKIVTLAENLIRLSGYIPYKDIDITFTGLRPGEKLFEELLLDEEGMRKTPNKKIFIGNPVPVDNETLMLALADMREAAAQNDVGAILAKIKDLVPTYRADTRTVAGARPKKE